MIIIFVIVRCAARIIAWLSLILLTDSRSPKRVINSYFRGRYVATRRKFVVYRTEHV